MFATPGWAQKYYKEAAFYLCAHQDDWQLFMGSDTYRDIASYDEKTPKANGKKVVIIYTTAGNLHDDDDSKSCSCSDPHGPQGNKMPYWQVREEGSKNSVQLAACQKGGWGPCGAYPKNKKVVINGHSLTKYKYKNTVSYYLRIKTGNFGAMRGNAHVAVTTVDSSTTYVDQADLVSTVYAIYKNELDSNVENDNATFHFPDVNDEFNPNDHGDHILTGKIANEAAKQLADDFGKCFTQFLYVDYDSQNQPINLDNQDLANKAAMVGVYCLSLLDYNAWPEWSELFKEWSSRSYHRTLTTCENVNIKGAGLTNDLEVRIYPNPADRELSVEFNKPLTKDVDISVSDIRGITVHTGKFLYKYESNYKIPTASLPNGMYIITFATGDEIINRTLFQVMH